MLQKAVIASRGEIASGMILIAEWMALRTVTTAEEAA